MVTSRAVWVGERAAHSSKIRLSSFKNQIFIQKSTIENLGFFGDLEGLGCFFEQRTWNFMKFCSFYVPDFFSVIVSIMSKIVRENETSWATLSPCSWATHLLAPEPFRFCHAVAEPLSQAKAMLTTRQSRAAHFERIVCWDPPKSWRCPIKKKVSNRVLDSGLTFSNVESASPIERSFDQFSC